MVCLCPPPPQVRQLGAGDVSRFHLFIASPRASIHMFFITVNDLHYHACFTLLCMIQGNPVRGTPRRTHKGIQYSIVITAMKILLLSACAACRMQTQVPHQRRISHSGAMQRKQRLRPKPDRSPVVMTHNMKLPNTSINAEMTCRLSLGCVRYIVFQKMPLKLRTSRTKCIMDPFSIPLTKIRTKSRPNFRLCLLICHHGDDSCYST